MIFLDIKFLKARRCRSLAARMEAICSPGECVISEVTYNMLSEKSDFSDIGNYRFKGIDRSIKLYQTKMYAP